MPLLKSDDSRLRTLWSEGIAIFENVLTTMVTSPRPRKETSNHFIVDIHYELMAVKLILANMQTSDGRTKSNQNNPTSPAQSCHIPYFGFLMWFSFQQNKTCWFSYQIMGYLARMTDKLAEWLGRHNVCKSIEYVNYQTKPHNMTTESFNLLHHHNKSISIKCSKFVKLAQIYENW